MENAAAGRFQNTLYEVFIGVERQKCFRFHKLLRFL